MYNEKKTFKKMLCRNSMVVGVCEYCIDYFWLGVFSITFLYIRKDKIFLGKIPKLHHKAVEV